jgi:endonuclease-3
LEIAVFLKAEAVMQTETVPSASKLEFDVAEVLRRISRAVAPYPKAMLFELFERGFRHPFEILVACLISIRTLDEVSLEVALDLFRVARRPSDIAALGVPRLDRILHRSTYHRQKAMRIVKIAELAAARGEDLPCDQEFLLNLPGVGPKTANLVLGIACGKSRIGVDIHVHRVTNRWGYVHTKTPLQTLDQLTEILPRSQWVRINALLVPFGKHICTGSRPKCSICPVRSYCRQVGVINPR